jgi:hypothetical protein
MVCRSGTFFGANEQNKQWTNWNGDVPFSAEEYFEPAHTAEDGLPDGLSQLVHVVVRATDEQRPLKAIGSGWAFEDIAKSDAWVVNLRQLTRKLEYVIGATSVALTDEWRQRQLDSAGSRRLIHVEAGIEVGALNEMLAAEGLAMRSLGGRNGQSIAGALSTSTHGGDWQSLHYQISFEPCTWLPMADASSGSSAPVNRSHWMIACSPCCRAPTPRSFGTTTCSTQQSWLAVV